MCGVSTSCTKEYATSKGELLLTARWPAAKRLPRVCVTEVTLLSSSACSKR
jgi:hypothetical protein